MPDEREDQEPKIKIVDRRMLSQEERAGTANLPDPTPEPADQRPKLEMVGGNASSLPNPPGEAVSAPISHDAGDATETVPTDELDDEAYDLDDEDPLSEEEAAQMREQVEQEQFAALEQQVGRPLTEQEKTAVRAEMDKQVQSMSKLEVAPVLIQMLPELSARAAVHLGLMPNPYTRLIARNDTEARLAIDAFGALFELVKTKVDQRSAAEYARVLNDLRVNFVQITGIPLGAPGAGSGPRLIR